MSSLEPRVPGLWAPSADIPEDVAAELESETRRVLAEPELPGPADLVPEDVLRERDREARLGQEEVRQRLSEGVPPIEDEPRS